MPRFECFVVLYRAKRLKPVIVDPGLYRSEPNVMFYAAQKRVLPNAYRLFTGFFCFPCLVRAQF